MGVSEPVFNCIKTKSVDNVCPKWVNKEFYIPYSIEKLFVFFNLAYMIKVSAKTERTLRSR